jgi:predicted RNA-binding protein associated with RNAse of E/G family
MKEAVNYEITIVKEEDFFVTIKKYNEMNGKFSIKTKDGKEFDYIKEGHFVVELTPINENYNIRYYLDSKKKIIDYYIDISLINGVEYKIPYYVDLYLDIIHYPNKKEVEFCDEDELKDALDKKIISKKDFNLAYSVGDKLLKEIKEHNNKYLNMDIISIVNKYY